MSENYQYAECKHCGQSLMEGQIHNCRQMLLAEIDALRVENTVLRQQKDEAWATTGLLSEQKRNDLLFTEVEWLRRNLNGTAAEYDEALGKIARLQVDLHQTVVDHDSYKSALKKIARGTLEPGHVYEQAVMMQDIAIKALNDAHGCTIDGAKVCFACAECDPVVADRP